MNTRAPLLIAAFRGVAETRRGGVDFSAFVVSESTAALLEARAVSPDGRRIAILLRQQSKARVYLT